MDFHNTIKGQESVSLPWRKLRPRNNSPPMPRLTTGQICLCKWRFIYSEELAEEAEGFQSIVSQWGEGKHYGIHFTNLTHPRATVAGRSCLQEAASESREQTTYLRKRSRSKRESDQLKKTIRPIFCSMIMYMWFYALKLKCVLNFVISVTIV